MISYSIKLLQRMLRHAAYLPGWHTKRKIIVFESDDWGSIRTSGKKELAKLSEKYPSSFADAYNRLDSLESNEDLEALFDVLRSVRDSKGNPAVLTANTVMANPDFKRIEEDGFSSYAFEPFTDTLKRYPNRDRVRDLISQGMLEKLYHPQLHGREHVNINQWLSGLRKGNEELMAAFHCGMYGVNLSDSNSMRNNFMAAFDFEKREELEQHKLILAEGQHLFRAEFGFNSASFIAPSYIWHPDLHPGMSQLGIRYLQGLSFQGIPNPGGHDFKKEIRYLGKKRNGITHIVRNAFFEPVQDQSNNIVNDCLIRMREVFKYGRPAIIGTHRVNFIGSLDENNRKNNLRQLKMLLNAIMEKWPEAEFMTTDQLGDIITCQ
jgi:hypothetical protein